eukprot:TRINITY_DN8869_c0_g1_i3.p1 TRINITY_DN8869_c0_g1~~TRINITY_DN8869_c0_g1_i3.p1  ORF type:complete len:237 (+),score=8.80 TRINITY_DN8869_c0_g1_i3:247-957(+)
MKPQTIAGHNAPLIALGDFILWFGWLSFNTGSTLGLTDGRYRIAGLIAANTVLSSSTACCTALIMGRLINKQYIMEDCFNSLLAGAVAITPACAVIDTWAAFITGIVAALLFLLCSRALLMFHIDDPLDAVSVHFIPGMWGLISLALFATPDNVRTLYGRADAYGLFLGGGAEQLGIQLVGIFSLLIWLCLWAVPMFCMFRYFKMLRVDHDTEVAGLDNTKHGGSAYPDFHLTVIT